MMKILSKFVTASLLVGMTTLSFALDFTAEDANNVFKTRTPTPEGIAAATQAANMYKELFQDAVETGKDELTQAQLLTAQSKALYYIADHATDKEAKKEGHFQGKELGQQAANLLTLEGKPTELKNPDYAPALGSAYYWLGANQGKWGLANGIINSLRQWPDLRQKMEYNEVFGQKHAELYGSNRILGWAYFKLPFPLGDQNKAFEMLEEAFNNTLDSYDEISTHGTTVVYYAQILISKGKKEKAREILEAFVLRGESEEELAEYNPDRIPETLEEIEEAKTLLNDL